MGKQLFDLFPRTCAQCRKKFESRPEYAYKAERRKDRYYYFCSWRCLRQWQRTHRRAG